MLVAVDSNYCVEAMLCGTPAINLQHPANTLFGPCYDAQAGVLDVEPGELAEAIRQLLVDTAFRERQQALAARARPYFNLGVDGLASARVAELMGEMAVGLVPKLLAWLDSRLPVAAERALIDERLALCRAKAPCSGCWCSSATMRGRWSAPWRAWSARCRRRWRSLSSAPAQRPWARAPVSSRSRPTPL